MTLETKIQTTYPFFKVFTREVPNRIKEHRPWIACPRCMNGSMYPESSREYVCIQCGYRSYKNTIARKPGI